MDNNIHKIVKELMNTLNEQDYMTIHSNAVANLSKASGLNPLEASKAWTESFLVHILSKIESENGLERSNSLTVRFKL